MATNKRHLHDVLRHRTGFISHPAVNSGGRDEWHDITPCTPMQNGFVESFNGLMRDDPAKEMLFLSMKAPGSNRCFGEYQNQQLPHSSLNYIVPAAFAAALGE